MNARIVEIKHAESGASARVLVSQGFNCFEWKAGPGDLFYSPAGFESGDQRPSSGGCPLLFPFPGRIETGKFEFHGAHYAVPEGDRRGNAIHGFVFNRAWRVVEQGEGFVTGEFQGSIDAPETLDLWPSDYKITVTYRIEATRLVCDVRYENPGDTDLPCGFGTHAYFRIPLGPDAAADQATITVPVRGQWATEGLIPTGELAANEASETLARGLRLEGWEFDSVFALQEGRDGSIGTTVESGAWRLVQRCGAEFGCYVIYTPGHREAVCIEPYTNVPNPFALEASGVRTGLQVLKPGAASTHTLEYQIESAG